MRVPQRRCQVGLLGEPFPVIQVGGDLGRDQVEQLMSGQPGVLGQIELNALPRAE
jgi:hypothetical protein